jgi:broad specificity phosphatase PhoE
MSDVTTPSSAFPAGLIQPSVLVLVRHGETAGNRDGRYQTYDTPLSDVGRAQAARLADRLLGEGAARALYSSDLARTMETAAIIGERLHLRPIPAPALRELDVGDWKGHPHAGIEERHPGGLTAWIAAGGAERLPGEAGECLDDVAARAIPFVESVARRHPGERVVLVSHGITLAVVLAHMRGWDRTEALAARRALVRNTAVSVVEIDADGGRRCPLLGCTAHLESLD